MALTGGCRLAYVAGLILGVMGILGAQGGSLTQAPGDSLLKIPAAGSRRKPPVKFSHRVHEARRVACAQCHHDYRGRRNVWQEGTIQATGAPAPEGVTITPVLVRVAVAAGTSQKPAAGSFSAGQKHCTQLLFLITACDGPRAPVET